MRTTPKDPTDEYYDQAFGGPRRPTAPQPERTPPAQEQTRAAQRPVRWWELAAFALSSAGLVSVVGLVGVVWA